MTGFEAFRMYIAMKVHFSSESYNIVKSNGAIEASRSAFENRKDRYFFEKVAGKVNSKNELMLYMLANFLHDPSFWIGEPNSEEVYRLWRARFSARKKIVLDDIENITNFLLQRGMVFDDLIKLNLGRHPPLFKMYLSETISMETAVLFLFGLKITSRWKGSYLDNDAIYKAEELRLRKYSCFFDIRSFVKEFEIQILSCFKANQSIVQSDK